MSGNQLGAEVTDGCQPETAKAWGELVEFLHVNFYEPDIGALRIALSVIVAHQTDESPVWIFVNGPAGSGKTAIIINSLAAIEGTFILGDLTPKTFLSGSKDSGGLLEIAGPKPIFLFKDFTTILSKRADDQREIAAQMREIYDGLYTKSTGMGGKRWEGKATFVACATPAVERAWAIHRDLGERFLQVRWLNGNSLAISKKARTQRNDALIGQQMRGLVRRFLNPGKHPDPTIEQGDRIDLVATAVARARTHVIREGQSREITDIGTPEEPSRIARGLQAVSKAHAAMFQRSTITPIDLAAGLRVGLDSIPKNRLTYINTIPFDGTIGAYNIAETTGMLDSTIRHQTDELESIGVISVNRQPTGNIIKFTDEFKTYWQGVYEASLGEAPL